MHARVSIVAVVVLITGMALPIANPGTTAQATGPMPIRLAFDRHNLSAEDRPILSSDGARVAYVVYRPPEKSAPYSRYLPTGVPVRAIGSRVWTTEVASGRANHVAREAGNCWRPSWSRDSTRLAMYCDGSGVAHVWVYDVKSNTTRRISDARVKPKLWAGDEPIWSGNGRELFVPLDSAATSTNSDSIQAVANGSRTQQEQPEVTIFTTKSPHSANTAPAGDLASLTIRENKAALAAIDVASGAYRVLAPADASPLPSVLRLSPSGRWVSYLSVFRGGVHDLAIVPAAGGRIRVLARDLALPAYDYHLGTYVWHPTRDQIVWLKGGSLWTLELPPPDKAGAIGDPRELAKPLAPITMTPLLMTRDGRSVIAGVSPLDLRDYRDPYPQAIAIVPLDGSQPRAVRLPEGMIFQKVVALDDVSAWQPDLDHLTVLVRDSSNAEMGLLRLNVETGAVTTLWKSLAQIRLVGASRDHAAVITAFEDVSTPPDLYAWTADFRQKRQVTSIEPRLANVPIGQAETFETTVPQFDGTLAKVATAVLLPPGAKRGDQLPGLVFLYPGSKVSRAVTQFGGGMTATVPASVFATRGYAVVLVELPIGPEGSPGNPIAEMVDALLPQLYRAAELGYVDVTRLAVAGQSYGGYGVLSTISSTNLFRAAVSISGTYDLLTMHSWMAANGRANMGRWAETGQGRMGNHPWTDIQRYLVNSPYYRAHLIHTPLLMLHGELDSSSPVEEGRKMFNALRRLERLAELRTYANEGHVLNEWSRVHAVDAVTRMLSFLEEHVRGNRPSPQQ